MTAFDIEGIDEIIHSRMRLGIVAYLASAEVADFNELKGKLKATQGNLSVHLSKLEEAGYVKIEKGFSGRKPFTRATLTASGRKAFGAYLDAMSKLLDSQK